MHKCKCIYINIYINNTKYDFTTLMSKQPLYADFLEGVLTNLFR